MDINKILNIKSQRDKSTNKNMFSNITMSNVFGKNPLSDMIGNITSKPLSGKPLSGKPLNNMDVSPKGASYKRQNEWKQFNPHKRQTLRNKYKDSDGIITDLEKVISELKTKNDELDAEKIELGLSNDNYKIENESLKEEISILKSNLTKKVAVSEKVKADDDKLKIGKLTEKEEAWISEAEEMKKLFI